MLVLGLPGAHLGGPASAPRPRRPPPNPVKTLATNTCCFAGRMTSLEGWGVPDGGIWLFYLLVSESPPIWQLSVARAVAGFTGMGCPGGHGVYGQPSPDPPLAVAQQAHQHPQARRRIALQHLVNFSRSSPSSACSVASMGLSPLSRTAAGVIGSQNRHSTNGRFTPSEKSLLSEGRSAR